MAALHETFREVQQQIILLECDVRNRNRVVVVTVAGEYCGRGGVKRIVLKNFYSSGKRYNIEVEGENVKFQLTGNSQRD